MARLLFSCDTVIIEIEIIELMGVQNVRRTYIVLVRPQRSLEIDTAESSPYLLGLFLVWVKNNTW